MKEFLLRWLVTTIAVAVAVQLTGMQADGWGALAAVALLLGIINAFVRPILMVLSIPFILVTLGFFILVLNALMLWLAGGLVPGLCGEWVWKRLLRFDHHQHRELAVQRIFPGREWPLSAHLPARPDEAGARARGRVVL